MVVVNYGLSLTKIYNFYIFFFLSSKSRYAIDWTKLAGSGSLTQGSGYLHSNDGLLVALN